MKHICTNCKRTTTLLSNKLCSICAYTNSKVNRYRYEARRRGLPDTLTLDQWTKTVNYFNGKCAYCKGKATLLEHFIPFCLGGGTTAENCVPACHTCNGRKSNIHPDAVLYIPKQDIERVRAYLISLKKL